MSASEKEEREIVNVLPGKAAAAAAPPAVPASQEASGSHPNELFTSTAADQNLPIVPARRGGGGGCEASSSSTLLGHIRNLRIIFFCRVPLETLPFFPYIIPNSDDSGVWGAAWVFANDPD